VGFPLARLVGVISLSNGAVLDAAMAAYQGKGTGEHGLFRSLNGSFTDKADLGALFLQRWHVELDLRNIKTTLGMETLSCKSPEMCEKELWVYLLAYNLIRLLK
jgi:hypothetical protein